MWWALTISAAFAQNGPDWTADELVTGVTNDVFAVAVGLRQWGLTDELFLVFQLYDEVGTTQPIADLGSSNSGANYPFIAASGTTGPTGP